MLNIIPIKKRMIRALQLVPFYAVSVGILLMPLIQSSLRQHNLQQQISAVYAAAETTQQAPTTVSGVPLRIVVASRGIDLPVHSGTYDSTTNTWTISKDAAYHAAQTPNPNNVGGNTFIYGHNLRQVFKPLEGLKLGDTAVVFTQNSLAMRYRFVSSSDVDPHAIQVLNDQTGNRLTLITCSGMFYQHRRLMVFEYEGYSQQ